MRVQAPRPARLAPPEPIPLPQVQDHATRPTGWGKGRPIGRASILPLSVGDIGHDCPDPEPACQNVARRVTNGARAFDLMGGFSWGKSIGGAPERA